MSALADSESKVYSQNGEDGVIKEIFSRLDIKSGVFLEFGAETGAQLNCRLLAESGWGGMFIEADGEKFALLKDHYAEFDNITCIESYVTPQNINDIIASIFDTVNIVSIDIDSIDYQIFDAISCKPNLFIVEYNGSLPLNSETSIVNTNEFWDYTANFGASLGALEKIAKKKGYSLVHTESHGVNSFFIRNDLLELFPEAADPVRSAANYSGFGENHPGLDLSTFVEY
jgi:hypothetical protein